MNAKITHRSQLGTGHNKNFIEEPKQNSNDWRCCCQVERTLFHLGKTAPGFIADLPFFEIILNSSSKYVNVIAWVGRNKRRAAGHCPFIKNFQQSPISFRVKGKRWSERRGTKFCPPQFIYWNPNFQCEGIRRQDF